VCAEVLWENNVTHAQNSKTQVVPSWLRLAATGFALFIFVFAVAASIALIQQSKKKAARLSMQAMFAESKEQHSQQRLKLRSHARERADQSVGVVSDEDIASARREEVPIVAGPNDYQGADFAHRNLQNLALEGSGSSFQGAEFDNANLSLTRISGGGSAFQLASFDDSDLSGADITGGGASFQAVSMARAKLIDAQIACGGGSFQLVNVDAAQFEGADLSGVDFRSLESWYFSTPPTYDERTRFPDGYLPDGWMWKEAEAVSGIP